MTHSALEFFERPILSINYEGSFDQEVFPNVGCCGPQVDSLTTENKNCIDLNRICLAIEVCLYQLDCTEKVELADFDLTFAYNTLHSLFSHAKIFLNGNLISSNNNIISHLAFTEIELATDVASKLTWAPCEGYRYRANGKVNQEVKEKELNDFKKGVQFLLELYGTLHIDFLDCEKLLLPGVTLHLRFYRSTNN